MTSVRTVLRRLWQMLTPDKRDVWQIYFYSVFNGMIALSLPLGIQAIFNLVQAGQISVSWVLLIVFVVAGLAFSGLLQIVQLYISERLQQKIFTKSAFEFALRIPRLRLESIDNYHAPELVNRFFDTLSLQKGITKTFIDFPAAILQILFGLILLSFYHPAFIVFGFFVLIFIYIIMWLNVPRGLETGLEESTYKYKVVHWLEEVARTMHTFKLAGDTSLPLERTDEHVVNYLNARKKHFKVLARQYGALVIFKMVVAATLLAAGGLLVIDRQLGLGQFVASEIIILMLMSSVEKLINSLETIYDVMAALEKIGYFTDIQLDHTEGEQKLPVKPEGIHLKLKDLTFAYPNQQEPLIKNVSIDLASGRSLCISGLNGSGKNSMLKLIAGFYDRYQGSIVFDGFPLKNLEINSLRNQISDTFGDQLVFYGTIIQNITMGKHDISIEEIQHVVKQVYLDTDIECFPQGYDTMIGPGGLRLSDSQTAKIILARCLVDRPRLLLLNDNLFNFGEKQNKQLLDILFSPENKWTIVINSNKLEIAKRTDEIIVMNKGEIAVQGNFQDISKNPLTESIFYA